MNSLKLITLSMKSKKDLERSAVDKRHIIVIQKIKKKLYECMDGL